MKGLLQKDLSSYAGGDMLLTVGEITLAPGAAGARHRHPGPMGIASAEKTDQQLR